MTDFNNYFNLSVGISILVPAVVCVRLTTPLVDFL